jgi:hypothetical protein
MNQVIITYFDLTISLSEFYNKPLEFYCNLAETHGIATLHFKNNLFSEITFEAIQGKLFLDDEDRYRCKELLEQNLTFAIQMWCNYHLYKKEIQSLEIRSKLR